MELTKGFKGRNVTCDNYFSTHNHSSTVEQTQITKNDSCGHCEKRQSVFAATIQGKKSSWVARVNFFIQAKHSACVIGGVDTLDQLAHSFTTKRKTKRWPLAMYTLPLQPFRDCRIIIFEGGFWARGLEYELIDDFCYTLIVIRTLGHILRQFFFWLQKFP